MTTPIEREFQVYARGEVREIILRNFREGLRSKIDPDTGELFSEDTIRRVTQSGSRFFVEADAIDLALLGAGKRAEFLAQQISHDRANHDFLVSRHAPLWGEQFLPGFSSTGTVHATGTPGTTWVGSTSIPDSIATFGTDPSGNRYQVAISGTADANGEADLLLYSIDTGAAVNIPIDTVITWANAPGGSDQTATVIDADFSGGSPPENDAAFIARLGSRIANKPAAGNAAQFRAWGREASVSVEDIFVYPTAFFAGSVLIAVTQKRGASLTRTARIPSFSVLQAVTLRLVPPGSPVVPPHVRVLVLAPVAEGTDVTLLLSLIKGDSTGWADASPFPSSRGSATAIKVTTLTNATTFRITAGSAGQLPGGVAGPLTGVSLMVWDIPTTSFIVLDVNTVEDLGGGVYRVILNAPPSGHSMAVNDFVSPKTQKRTAIAEGVRAYFDSLGPGEVVALGTDTRGVTAFRRPPPSEEFPQRAGQSLITFVSDALGSALADAQLDVISVTTPAVPTDPSFGPSLVVIHSLCVLPLD